MAFSEFELLRDASDSNESPEFKKNVIEAVKDDKLRERLVDDQQTINAVHSCEQIVSAKMLQFLIIHAIIREAIFRQRRGESFPSKILIGFCDSLSHLIQSYDSLLSRGQTLFSNLLEKNEISSEPYSHLIVKGFIIVSDASPSLPAVLNAQKVIDVTYQTVQHEQDVDQQLQEELIRIFAKSLYPAEEEEEETLSLLESSHIVMKRISRELFAAHIVSVLEKSLETLAIEVANDFLGKMRLFFLALKQVRKGHYLQEYMGDDGFISKMADTSMELLIRNKGKLSESVPSALCAIIEACPRNGFILISEVLVDALKVDGTVIGDVDEVHNYLFQICDCLERVAITGAEVSRGRYEKSWFEASSEVIEILTMMGRSFNSAALLAYEKIGGEATKKLKKSKSGRSVKDDDTISPNINKEDAFEKVATKPTSQNKSCRSIGNDDDRPGVSKVSGVDQIEERILAKQQGEKSRESIKSHRDSSKREIDDLESRIDAKLSGVTEAAMKSSNSGEDIKSTDQPGVAIVSSESANDKIMSKQQLSLKPAVSQLSSESGHERNSNDFEEKLNRKLAGESSHMKEAGPKNASEDRKLASSGKSTTNMKEIGLSNDFEDRLNRKLAGDGTSSKEKGIPTLTADEKHLNKKSSGKSWSNRNIDANVAGIPMKLPGDRSNSLGSSSYHNIMKGKMAKYDDGKKKSSTIDPESSISGIEDRIAAKLNASLKKSGNRKDDYEPTSPTAGSSIRGDEIGTHSAHEERLNRKLSGENRSMLNMDAKVAGISMKLPGDRSNSLGSSTYDEIMKGKMERYEVDLKKSTKIDPESSISGIEDRIAAKLNTSFRKNEDSQDDYESASAAAGHVARKMSTTEKHHGLADDGMEERIRIKTQSSITSDVPTNPTKDLANLDKRIEAKQKSQPNEKNTSSRKIQAQSNFASSLEPSEKMDSDMLTVSSLHDSSKGETSSHELAGLLDNDWDRREEGRTNMLPTPTINENDLENTGRTRSFVVLENTEIVGNMNGEGKRNEDEEDAIAVALAIDDGTLDEIDEAAHYDPSAKARMKWQMRIWAIISLLVAVSVAVLLGIILSRKKIQANEDLGFDPPSPAPTTSMYQETASLIRSEFGFDKSYEINTAYGKALEWMAEDKIANDAIKAGKLKPDFYERYFLGLFYFSMSGNNWVNCSMTGGFRQTCSHFNRDGLLIEGSSKWMSPFHVCRWAGISCDDDENVRMLDLNRLGLLGSIPSEINRLKNLQVLSLIDNYVYGRIPAEIGSLIGMLDIDLHINDLTGKIPDELYSLTNLLAFNLGYNKLTGTISPNIGNITILKAVHVHENSLSGSIPSEIGKLSESLGYLTLSSNRLNGTLPLEVNMLTNLKEIYFDKNSFEGPLQLPIAEGLVQIPVHNNNFNGTLPDNLYRLNNLAYFIADNNKFTGELSPSIGNLTKLKLMSLRSNQFSGQIPKEIGNLTELETLRLHYNTFTGQVSLSICDLFQQRLTQFYADCKNDLQRGDRYYGIGEPEVQCECCTDCCDPGLQGECSRMP